jgi:plastocyanin
MAATPLLGAIMLVPTSAAPAQAAPARAASAHPAATVRASAGAPPVVIGVDNTPPAGKNWEYTHYFPESNVNVPQGGTVLFQWNQGSLNGLHSVTFVPAGSTVAQERATYPTLQADTDQSESGTIIPPISNNPTSFGCSTSPTSPPCVFDGTSVVSSGIIPTSTGAAFAMQIAPTVTPGTYSYFCVIHPGMQGTINVEAAGQPASAQSTLATQATSELNGLNAGAAKAEAAASVPTSTVNANGSHTWTVHVGITADDVELLEYLPANAPIAKGDSVKFDGSGTTQEPHTVTSQLGALEGLIPFPPTNDCEAANGPDTPAASVNNGPPETGCADPNGFEQPLNLHSQGEPAVVSSVLTATSAVVSGRADVQAAGGEASHTYQFPNGGTYVFFCAFHQNMGGIVGTPGYHLGASNGDVYNFGGSGVAGSHPGTSSPVVAVPATLDNQGYWLVTADGHTYNFGDAPDVGNLGVALAAPIVGAAVGAGMGAQGPAMGLYLVAKDGGVFALGGTRYQGSMGGKHLNAPIVGITTATTSPGGNGGYDLVASDGGVFTFGSNGNGSGGGPRFFGSMGGKHLNAPIVGIADTADSAGYYLAASDGGVFGFGSATFEGSTGGQHLNAPITGISVTGDLYIGRGYTLSAADGGVFTFGDATFLGSAAPFHPGSIVGIGGT